MGDQFHMGSRMCDYCRRDVPSSELCGCDGEKASFAKSINDAIERGNVLPKEPLPPLSILPARPKLRAIEGGGGIVEALESALEMARAGYFEMVAIVAINDEQEIMTRLDWRGDVEHVWSRAYAALASFQHDLLEDGL